MTSFRGRWRAGSGPVPRVAPRLSTGSGSQHHSATGGATVFGRDSDYWSPAETVIATIALGGWVSDIVASPESEYMYVAQSDSVAVIGSGNHIVGRIPVIEHPYDLAIAADGTRLFAISYGGTVSVINTEDHVVQTISGGWNSDVAVSPDGAHIYAGENPSFAGGSEGFISVIDAEGAIVATVPVVNEVTALAVSRDGSRLYVASSNRRSYYQYPAGWLTIIDTASYTVITTIAVGASPDTMTVSPDGAHLYITHYDTQSVSAVDLSTTRVTTIALGDIPIDVTFTPDGTHAYVTTLYSVTGIDTGTNDTADIATGDLPRGLQISPDGKRAYITNFGDHTVSVVDTITNSVKAAVAVSGHPEAIAVSADGERVYVGDYWSGTVTVISTPSVQDQHR